MSEFPHEFQRTKHRCGVADTTPHICLGLTRRQGGTSVGRTGLLKRVDNLIRRVLASISDTCRSILADADQAAQVAKLAATAAKNNVSDEEKLLWVQNAASAYGIDWRVLAAVWQKESGQQFYTTVRSSAGAQGPCQFMPGTWKGYAKDGNGDGVKDVYDARDCLFAAADLLARNGGSSGNYYKALLSYNHATWYVEAVLKLAYSY